MRNKRGPSTEPCGTPAFKGRKLDSYACIITFCFLFSR